MILKLLLLFLFVSCSHKALQVDGRTKNSVKFVKKSGYFDINGAGDVLRNKSEATLFITFRQTGKQEEPQDMLSFSVGAEKPTFLSRASLRIEKDGYLTGIARAGDNEEAQNVRSKEKVQTGEFHSAALVIDYGKDSMRLFLDGRPLETEGNVNFKAEKTSDTSSIGVTMGAEDDGSNFFFKGELKDPKVWTRSLSAEEILIQSQN